MATLEERGLVLTWEELALGGLSPGTEGLDEVIIVCRT